MARYIIYTSDEENNIDIEIDVAYKWDVILTLAGADMHRISPPVTPEMLPTPPRFFSLKHNSVIDRAVARLVANACVGDDTPIAAST